jgi:hypothetical protein
MKTEAIITFNDKGEAARWLALYHNSRLYELPDGLRGGLVAEFPWKDARDTGVTSEAIQRAALRMLSDGEVK